eukprot:scaffold7756_cov93-Isochrysis_galbana.AAC.1
MGLKREDGRPGGHASDEGHGEAAQAGPGRPTDGLRAQAGLVRCTPSAPPNGTRTHTSHRRAPRHPLAR